MKAMLIDSTLCVGCRGCQVACKEWNKLPAEPTEFFGGDGYQNPKYLSAKTWTLITYNEVEDSKGLDWVFGKRQCFHCVDPACVSVCPIQALTKSAEGPVVYNKDVCLGCRYCQLACPFGVPGFEWEKAIPVVRKCTLCADRIQAGGKPACAGSCPTGAIQFGEREEMIQEAKQRIRQSPGKYVDHIYGLEEVGGTCVLHISNVPFNQLAGFPSGLPNTAVGLRTRPSEVAIPYIMTGLGLALGGISWVINRKKSIEQEHSSGEDKS